MFALDVPGHWNFKRLLAVLGVSFLLQMTYLPCLCNVGRTKMAMGVVLDFLIVCRAGIAYVAHERGNGWKFYAWLAITSPAWITLAAYLILGDAG